MPKMLRLPVNLTPDEKLKVAMDMSAAQTALEAAKAEKKEAMKDHNEIVKGHETQVHVLNVSLSTGTVEREVPVEDRPDPISGKLVCYRLDTNEPVNTRSLDPEERQLMIGDAPGPAPAETIGADDRAEEQAAAGTPDEAESLRDTRLAEEAATRAFDAIRTGEMVEILISGEWIHFAVDNKTEFHFEANGKLFDVSKHLASWRLPPTWDEVKAASAEEARLAEIDRLANEQTKDAASGPKTLLQNPRKKAAEKKNKIVNEKDEPIVVPPEPAADDHPANGEGDKGLLF